MALLRSTFAPRAPPRVRTIDRRVRARNRILFDPKEIDQSSRRVTLHRADSRAVHLTEVLGVRVGSSLRVGTIGVGRCDATVRRIDEDGSIEIAFGAIDERVETPEIDLLLAMPRPKVLRRLWAPLASLGIGRIVLTNANKVERYYFDSKALEIETIREELLRGLEQAGDYRIPQVGVAKRLPPIVDRVSGVLDKEDTNGFSWLLEGDSAWNLGADVLLLAHPGQAATSVAEALDDVKPNQRVLLAIGPEGGWTDYELELLEKAGFRKVGLGSRTFTTDVACISLVSAVRERLQSWR